MAKWSGNLGFVISSETTPGIWTETVVTKKYKGELDKNFRRTASSDKIMDNLSLSNTISVVMDAYVNANFSSIRFIEFMGTYWKVSSIDVQRPRIIISIGEVYNGQTQPT